MNKTSIAMVIFSFIMSGCSSNFSGLYRLAPDNYPKEKLAKMQGCNPIVLLEVDGKHGPNYKNGQYNARGVGKEYGCFIIEIESGIHEFLVDYTTFIRNEDIGFGGKTQIEEYVYITKTPKRKNVNMEAGSVYQFVAYTYDNYTKWDAELIKININGRNTSVK